MYFDTHAHYDDPQFDADREEVLAALADAGVELVVDPGSDVRSSRLAAEIAEKHAFVYAAAGVHPESAADFTPEARAELRARVFALDETFPLDVPYTVKTRHEYEVKLGRCPEDADP